MRLSALLRNHARPLMAKALTHYQGERNQNCAEQAVPHPYRSETGPLGLTMVALPRLSLTSVQLS